MNELLGLDCTVSREAGTSRSKISAIDTLGAQDVDFDLAYVQPARMLWHWVKLEVAQDVMGLLSRQGAVECQSALKFRSRANLVLIGSRFYVKSLAITNTEKWFFASLDANLQHRLTGFVR